MHPAIILLVALVPLGACSGGNVQSTTDYHAPKAPPLRQPYYDADAGYGSSHAVWTPPVVDRDATIVKPADPNVSVGRPDYEHSRWATGAAGGSDTAPPGTF